MPRMPRTVEYPAFLERFIIQNAHESPFGRGGIHNESILTLRHCVVSHNVASAAGGGIYNQDGATLTLIDSTISDNASELWGGGICNHGVLTLDHSTVIRNRTTAFNLNDGNGGGIYNSYALTVVDSSISANEATLGGGIYTNLSGAGETTIAGSAVTGNLAHRRAAESTSTPAASPSTTAPSMAISARRAAAASTRPGGAPEQAVSQQCHGQQQSSGAGRRPLPEGLYGAAQQHRRRKRGARRPGLPGEVQLRRLQPDRQGDGGVPVRGRHR